MSEIEKLVGGVSFEDYAASWSIQRATERGLEIISESSRHLPDALKDKAAGIPWRQIAAIGNLDRHEYQRTDPKATWNIVKEHLPRLADAIARLTTAETQEKP